MNDLEKKRKRIELAVKLAALGVTGFFVAPFIFITIQGLVGLIVAAAIGAAAINFAPYVAWKFANWRLKALKAEFNANPIETMENLYKEKEQGLIQFRENILAFHAEVQNFYSEMEDQRSKGYTEAADKFLEQYQKMRQLLAMRSEKYKQAQAKLKQYADLIDAKRSEWRLAQAAAKMTKAANVGEDFMSKLANDTALDSIQTSLNTAFAELEVSLLDETPVSAAAPAKAVSEEQQLARLTEKSGPPTLDIEFEEPSAKSVKNSRQRLAE